MKNLAVILPENESLVVFILNCLQETNSPLIPNVEIDKFSLLQQWKPKDVAYLFFHKNRPCELKEFPVKKGIEYLEEGGIKILHTEDVFNLPQAQ